MQNEPVQISTYNLCREAFSPSPGVLEQAGPSDFPTQKGNQIVSEIPSCLGREDGWIDDGDGA